MPARKININEKYGKLFVLEQSSFKRGNYKYKVKCDCGNIVDVFLSQKIQRNQLHCGCDTKKTHGLCGTKIYKIWTRLKCLNKLCDKWQDINQFVKDVGIEAKGFIRPVYGGIIGPNNFQWVSKYGDARGDFIIVNNIPHNIRTWAKICGISRQALYANINKKKRTPEEIILSYSKAKEYIDETLRKNRTNN